MARAHFVKKARKAIKGTDIKKGDSYYWWKFRFGGKHTSKTPPRRSQLTQSAFLGALYDLEDRIGDAKADADLPDELRSIAEELRSLAEECEEKHGNMPDSLQESDTGQMLQDRAQACNDAADELDQIADGCDVADKEADQSEEEYWQAQLEEAQAVSIDAP